MRFITAMFLFLAVNTAAAQENHSVLAGPGTATCAEFAKGYRENPTDTETFFYAWAQGWMSAFNFLAWGAKKWTRDLNAWSLEDQLRRIRYFCEQNPLSDYLFAVKTLYFALPEVPPHSN